jgi:DNA-directed RNA polymerase specialized sigma24 family protein
MYMTIPNDILDIIMRVANRIAPKYVFVHYTKDDLIQEAILMGMDAYKRWDKKRPFENFVSNHISRRLKTLKRDKYYRSNNGKDLTKAQQAKKNIINPNKLSYDIILTLLSRKTSNHNEFWERIDEILPANMRKDYLKMRSGVKVTAVQRKKIIEFIKENGKKNG